MILKKVRGYLAERDSLRAKLLGDVEISLKEAEDYHVRINQQEPPTGSSRDELRSYFEGLGVDPEHLGITFDVMDKQFGAEVANALLHREAPKVKDRRLREAHRAKADLSDIARSIGSARTIGTLREYEQSISSATAGLKYGGILEVSGADSFCSFGTEY